MVPVITLVVLTLPIQHKLAGTDIDSHRAAAIKEYGLEPNACDTPLRKLQKERCIDRAMALAIMRDSIAIGGWNSTDLNDHIKLHNTLADNLAELSDKPADWVKWYEMRVAKLKEVEKFMQTRSEVGSDAPQLVYIAIAARKDAEIALLKLKESIKGEQFCPPVIVSYPMLPAASEPCGRLQRRWGR
jgi:hypothetical protein